MHLMDTWYSEMYTLHRLDLSANAGDFKCSYLKKISRQSEGGNCKEIRQYQPDWQDLDT